MATSKTVAPYGSWKSPITSDILTQKNVSFGEIAVISSSNHKAKIAFIENRPEEAGRAAIVKKQIDLKTLASPSVQEDIDLTQGRYNARSGVHEYGGGALRRAGEGTLLFTDYSSYNVLELREGLEAKQITKDNKALRYADFASHPTEPFIICIQEDHTVDTPDDVVNTIVCLNKSDSSVQVLVSGSDFYSCPRISPDGKHVAWVSWNHPSMPFFATRLWVAALNVDSGTSKITLQNTTLLGSETADEVTHHPEWADNETLVFGNDASGFLNLYKVRIGHNTEVEKPSLITKGPLQSEFLLPAWTLNDSCFAVLGNGWLACIMIIKAITSLTLLHVDSGELRKLQTPFIVIQQVRSTSSDSIVFVGTQTNEPSAIIVMDLTEAIKGTSLSPKWGFVKRSSTVVETGKVPRDFLTKAEAVEFPTELPDGTKTTAHAIILPPCNPDFVAPAGTSPPCIVKIHGGPTSHATAGLNLSHNYWTSKGYMICVVNYGGSTGYGREYMLRLDGQWGVVDVRDAVAAATYLGSSQNDTATSSSQNRGYRRITEKAQSELARLKETRTPNGAIEYTLDNPGSWLPDITDAIMISTLATAGVYLPGIEAIHGLAAAGLAYLLRKMTHVQQESVMAIPTIGLQLTTLRGFSMPWKRGTKSQKNTSEIKDSSDGSGHTFFTTSKQTKLIPRDCILDVFTNEAFRRYGIVDYIAVATQSPSGSKTASRGDKLDVLFPNLLPRLPIVEQVYRGLYPAIFGHEVPTTISSSTQATDVEKKSFAQSSAPRADPSKIAISGGSAGGYTVLASLCLYPRAFSAGCSMYGVSDVAALEAECHKFESRYTHRLMGGSSAEIPDVYRKRSPLFMADRIKSPILLLQGDLDKVVPPEQSEGIYKILKENGTKTKYILYEGEGHGFRKADTVKKALKEEEEWYQDCFGIPSS